MNHYIYTQDPDGFYFNSNVPQKSILFFISYDYDEKDIPGTIIKHGSQKTIENYLNKNGNNYIALEADPVFHTTKFFVVDVTSVAIDNLDEVNKCLEITGYIKKFLNNFNLLPDQYDGCEIID